MARDLAQERRKGADPAADRKANREADRQAKETFADLAKQYLAAKQMAVRLGDMRASTVDSYSRMLKLHIFPRLGLRRDEARRDQARHPRHHGDDDGKAPG
jgi:hypothetical protein